MTQDLHAFLYCIEFVHGEAAKVGVASDPRSRLQTIRGTAPFDMNFRHVLEMEDRREADAWEGYIISAANRYKDRGEWVIADDKLDRLFAQVKDSTDRTDAFRAEGDEAGRIVKRSRTASLRHVNKVRLARKVGAGTVKDIKYCGRSREFKSALIKARLRQGYGVEDMLAMDGIPLEDSRAVIASLKEQGVLRQVMGLNPQPTARAS